MLAVCPYPAGRGAESSGPAGRLCHNRPIAVRCRTGGHPRSVM
jgi:hypothetical protein